MITKVILDFETSGLNPYHDDIIEIAMKVMDSDIQFTTLIKPKSIIIKIRVSNIKSRD